VGPPCSKNPVSPITLGELIVPASLRPRLRRLATKAVALSVAGVLGSAAAASAITGVDVSRWQHNPTVNWTKVEADNVSFTFIKATESANYVNPYFASDWAKAKSAGIYRGAYHFARPSVGSAKRQAQYFVAHAGKFHAIGDLPPVLDLESSGGLGVAKLRTWTAHWLQTVKTLTGRTPIIYTGPSFWETAMGNSTAFHAYPLWIAHYTSTQPRVPGGWPHWTFWQNSSTGHVSGITGAVDMDRFYGTRAQLAALAHAAPVAGAPGTTPDPGTTTPDPGTTPPDPGTTPTEPTPTTPVAKTATQASLNLSSDTVFRGKTVAFSGHLVDAAGTPMPDRRVDLYRRAAGSSTWTKIASPATGTTGRYSMSFAASGSASFKVTYAGSQRFASSVSALRALAVRQPVRTRATLAIEHTAQSGRAVKLYGHLTTTADRPLVDRTMFVYQRTNGSSRWLLVARSSTLSPSGWYQAFVQPSRTSAYKAEFRGGLAFTRSVSNLTTVRAG
jgi:GH25 family lysozyme M1 (1,4-beta-N-acetylmuramidase)